MRFRPLLLALCIATLAGIVCSGTAFAQPPASIKGPVPVALPTKDGIWQLAATYYESPAGKESPVVILLHGEGGNRLVWSRFAEFLQKEGIAAITVDLRKHGESKAIDAKFEGEVRVIDYPSMVLYDLPAVKKFIYEEHQKEKLNMRKTGIVASDTIAPVAVNFALQDWLAKPHRDAPTLDASTPRGQDVRAIALLSPVDSAGKVRTSRELLTLRNELWNVAFMFAKADGDKLDRRDTDQMFEKVEKGIENADSRMYKQVYKTRYRGTDLLGRGRTVPVEAHLLQFFKLHLKDLSGENDGWRDRKSKI